jgi:hypothetical protein
MASGETPSPLRDVRCMNPSRSCGVNQLALRYFLAGPGTMSHPPFTDVEVRIQRPTTEYDESSEAEASGCDLGWRECGLGTQTSGTLRVVSLRLKSRIPPSDL